MGNVIFYRESFFIKAFNLFIIAAVISYRMTILPDLIFGSLMTDRFSAVFFIILEVIALFVNRLNGLVIKWKVLKYPPLLLMLVLVCLQMFVALLHGQIVSLGAAVFTGLNDFLLVVLVYSLLCARNSIIPREYIYFAIFNIGITIVALLLTILGIISPYTNEVNNLSSLFSGNVSSGQTYYMPGYLAIQSSNVRVSLANESYLGWTFEPHVFGLFVIPAVIFMIAKGKKKSNVYLWVAIGIIVLLEAFSVTAFLSIMGCVLIYLLLNYAKGARLTVGILILIIVVYYITQMNTNMDFSFWAYTQDKLIYNTGSSDYSSNNLEHLFLPNSIIGDGIFGWNVRHKQEPNIGLLSWPFAIAYFISVGLRIKKTIKSSIWQVSIVGIGVLYTILHMLKLAQSAFCMPFLFMILVILCRAEEESHIKKY